MEARSWSPPPRPYCHASAPSPSPPPQPPHTSTCLVLLNFFSALFTDSGSRVFLAPLSCFKQTMKTSRGGSLCATSPISIFLLSFQVGAAVKWEQFAISRCRPSLPNYRPPNCSHISNCSRGAESLNEKMKPYESLFWDVSNNKKTGKYGNFSQVEDPPPPLREKFPLYPVFFYFFLQNEH